MSASNPTQNQDQPGLIASHASYVKGAATETIGTLSGSKEWQDSGAETKQHAVQAMKEAGEKRDPQRDGYGKVEEVAGRIAGCEGMEREGASSGSQGGGGSAKGVEQGEDEQKIRAPY